MLNAVHFIAKLIRFKRYLKVTGFEFKNRNKILRILVKPYKNGCRCQVCERRCPVVGTLREVRQLRDLPVHGIEVFLIYHPREIKCPTHGRFQERKPWAEGLSRVPYRFKLAPLRCALQMTGKAAAQLLRIPKSTMSDLLYRIIKRIRNGHKIRGLTVLGVDEIGYCKGNKYSTIAYDLDRSKVIWVGKGKGGATLERFFKTQLSEHQRGKIKSECYDMGQVLRIGG